MKFGSASKSAACLETTCFGSAACRCTDTLSRLQARVLEWVPGKPFSYDNYLSLQVPSVCEHNDFPEFGIRPTNLESIVPSYIGGRGKMDFYQKLRRAAGRERRTG